MPFEKGRASTRKPTRESMQERLHFVAAEDTWSVVLKVRSWDSQLREGSVSSCAEIARREGITRARVSQLWPLARIIGKRIDDVLKAGEDRRVSLRRLLRIVRETDANEQSHGLRKRREGN